MKIVIEKETTIDGTVAYNVLTNGICQQVFLATLDGERRAREFVETIKLTGKLPHKEIIHSEII